MTRSLFNAPTERRLFVEDAPVEVAVVEVPFVVDPNPLGLPVYHAPGTDTPGHLCAPRIDAICAQCGFVAHHCMNWNGETEAICKAELGAILDKRWRCRSCAEAV